MKRLLILAALSAGCGLALANSCPNEMKAIDAKLATSPKLADADMAKVKKLRADGETAHKAGKHDESMKALGEAKKLLGI
jgi:Tfp pilus assembly protein PilN